MALMGAHASTDCRWRRDVGPLRRVMAALTDEDLKAVVNIVGNSEASTSAIDSWKALKLSEEYGEISGAAELLFAEMSQDSCHAPLSEPALVLPQLLWRQTHRGLGPADADDGGMTRDAVRLRQAPEAAAGEPSRSAWSVACWPPSSSSRSRCTCDDSTSVKLHKATGNRGCDSSAAPPDSCAAVEAPRRRWSCGAAASASLAHAGAMASRPGGGAVDSARSSGLPGSAARGLWGCGAAWTAARAAMGATGVVARVSRARPRRGGSGVVLRHAGCDRTSAGGERCASA
mmetsp:Transcript_75542/g.211750  ORF Transcript_75542/g.211750 Transcript_75542/m.211750 type:complete len:288 (+) Transcript_75542:78-941(+)